MSMLQPPAPQAKASFASDFGRRTLLTIDTEEEFNWDKPFAREGHAVTHVDGMIRFQAFAEELGVSPVYLIDWPILETGAAVEFLADAAARGTAELGLQLHPWVNPPFEEEVSERNSFAGNLPQALEAAKLERLNDAFQKCFDAAPLIYRAGRYGLGPHTAGLLQKLGIPIDSSVRANYDYSHVQGPNYSRHPLEPYWAARGPDLLELPLTTVHWGVLRQQGRQFAPLLRHVPSLGSVLSRSRMLEKIPLTPEGVTAEEALRGSDIAIDSQLPLSVLSFHSPSLSVGHTPYVKSEAELEQLYDWMRTIYGHFASSGVTPTNLIEILRQVRS
jgi:hypothetical protein